MHRVITLSLGYTLYGKKKKMYSVYGIHLVGLIMRSYFKWNNDA